jgi:hypothetical protein
MGDTLESRSWSRNYERPTQLVAEELSVGLAAVVLVVEAVDDDDAVAGDDALEAEASPP